MLGQRRPPQFACEGPDCAAPLRTEVRQSKLSMISFRIIPNRGTYKVEVIQPNGPRQVLGTWRTEEEAVSHRKKLEAEAHRGAYRPAPGEVGGPTPPRR